jgi:hypothetical protein
MRTLAVIATPGPSLLENAASRSRSRRDDGRKTATVFSRSAATKQSRVRGAAAVAVDRRVARAPSRWRAERARHVGRIVAAIVTPVGDPGANFGLAMFIWEVDGNFRFEQAASRVWGVEWRR